MGKKRCSWVGVSDLFEVVVENVGDPRKRCEAGDEHEETPKAAFIMMA